MTLTHAAAATPASTPAISPKNNQASSCGLAVFVKTPSLSPIKTRLAADIGRGAAEMLYVALTRAVASIATQARAQAQAGLCPYWAVAEDTAFSQSYWPIFDHVVQGEGSLGERMGMIYRALRERHRAVILIGADAPQLSAQSLGDAVQWLASDTPRHVIGRACDGGFWLFGSNTDISRSAWTAPEYSRPDTAERFMASIGDSAQWRELEVLRDIDTVSDIAPVLHALRSLTSLTPEQARLVRMLDTVNHLPTAVP